MSGDVKSKRVPTKKSNASFLNDNEARVEKMNTQTQTELEEDEKMNTSVDESQGTKDEDDPCDKKNKPETIEKETVQKFRASPGLDPRFQQQNQTVRCFVMYNDFYRCEKILGDGHEACTWFRDVFKSICPNDWIRNWDELREDGRFPWSRAMDQENSSRDRVTVDNN